MKVCGHRSRDKAEEGVGEGAVDVLGIPSVIGGGVGDGKTGRKGFRKVVRDDRNSLPSHRGPAALIQRSPWTYPASETERRSMYPHPQSPSFSALMPLRTIVLTASGSGVEPRHEEQRGRRLGVEDRAGGVVADGVVQDPRDLWGEEAQYRKFGIDRGGVAGAHGGGLHLGVTRIVAALPDLEGRPRIRTP